ncbi:hypothetical protein IMZ48_21480 [Candidatus Bathyarchaeota archaeon]|nr:hypothetical protein [Candidatus Bathyarchaeota archaeon]
MCFKITTHSMHCDVRPIGRHGTVNGYAHPTPCACPPSPKVAPWLRCPCGHGCCRIATRTQRCDIPCPTPPKPFHIYERAHISTTPWTLANVLNGEVLGFRQPAIWEDADMRGARMHMDMAAEDIQHAKRLVLAIQQEVRIVDMLHRMDHGECPWCPLGIEIAELQRYEVHQARELMGLMGEHEEGLHVGLPIAGAMAPVRAQGLNLPLATIYESPFEC